ncbi:hypothetical protein [Leptolyngbya sp. AN02str]|uniref:hypothetical protein n=1 Tax=Leptolyngbya sp. AN02str TaxID=3423363 RepID=UPI003D30F53A
MRFADWGIGPTADRIDWAIDERSPCTTRFDLATRRLTALGKALPVDDPAERDLEAGESTSRSKLEYSLLLIGLTRCFTMALFVK